MENQKEIAEKRKNFRSAIYTPINYRIFSENDMKPLSEWKKGTTENVSIDGIQFITFCDDKQIEILTNECIVLLTDFLLVETGHNFKCKTKLNYFKKLAGTKVKEIKTVFLGLSFINMDENDKNVVSDFIRKKCDYTLPLMEMVNC